MAESYQERIKALEARAVVARDRMVQALRDMGSTVETYSSGRVASVNKINCDLEVVLVLDMDSFRCEYNGIRCRIKVYNSGSGKYEHRSYPEGKNGFNVDKIVRQLLEFVKDAQQRKVREAEAKVANRDAKTARTELARACGITIPESNWYEQEVVGGGPELFCLKLSGLNWMQVRELLEFARGEGMPIL